jgi:hypothetical protein
MNSNPGKEFQNIPDYYMHSINKHMHPVQPIAYSATTNRPNSDRNHPVVQAHQVPIKWSNVQTTILKIEHTLYGFFGTLRCGLRGDLSNRWLFSDNGVRLLTLTTGNIDVVEFDVVASPNLVGVRCDWYWNNPGEVDNCAVRSRHAFDRRLWL